MQQWTALLAQEGHVSKEAFRLSSEASEEIELWFDPKVVKLYNEIDILLTDALVIRGRLYQDGVSVGGTRPERQQLLEEEAVKLTKIKALLKKFRTALNPYLVFDER